MKYPEIELDVQEELAKKCKEDVPKFYKAITCTQSLLKSLPTNKFLENLKCLHPMYRLEPKIIRFHMLWTVTDEWLQTQDFNYRDEISEEDSGEIRSLLAKNF